MKTIMVTISRGYLIRNFFQSGIIGKLLNEDCRVVVLSPNYDDPELFKDYQHENLYLEPLIKSTKIRFQKLFRELFKGAAFNQTVHVRYRYRFTGATPNKLLYIPRMLFFAPLRIVPGFKKLIRFIEFKINPQAEHDYLFEKHHPDLVFVTAAGGGDPDTGVLKSSRRFGVKSVIMPKSWDNLSKTLFAAKADVMMLWSPFMRDQAIKFQDYKLDQILMTGVPQFDFYHRKENLLSREEFCQQHNLDPNKKIILYGSTGGNCCEERQFVDLLNKFIQEDKLSNAQVLVRPHLGYVGDLERFEPCEKPGVCVVDRTDKQSNKFKDHWDVSINHVNNLFNSLHHADVCVNMASTLTLDATACNTPAINVNFDVDPNVDPNWSTKRLYKSDYIGAATGTGGTWLTNSSAELLSALKEILEENKRKDQGVKKLIDYFVYKNDGQSSKRIVNYLVNLINI
jgi:hypothetical protein